MPEKLTTIGHIVEDTASPENVLGGGVSYSGMMANELGLEVQVITKITPDHRFLDLFADRGIDVLTLPTASSEVTTFTNSYDGNGNRRQLVSGRQETITHHDLERVPSERLNSSYILVAPVIDEVDTDAIPHLSRHGRVAVTPQGYFRRRGDGGVIYQQEWSGFENDLSHAALTVMSEEDISQDGIINGNLLEKIASASPITVLTRGERGATVFRNGQKDFDVHAFSLGSNDGRNPDFTGAGDTFTASLIAKLMTGGDYHDAGVFAALIAAIKISAVAGKGIDSIPNRQQIDKFMEEHNTQLRDFLARNQSSERALSF